MPIRKCKTKTTKIKVQLKRSVFNKFWKKKLHKNKVGLFCHKMGKIMKASVSRYFNDYFPFYHNNMLPLLHYYGGNFRSSWLTWIPTEINVDIISFKY